MLKARLQDARLLLCLQEGDTESLPQFEQLFEGAQFRKGMELAFTNTKSGGLAAKIDNRDVRLSTRVIQQLMYVEQKM